MYQNFWYEEKSCTIIGKRSYQADKDNIKQTWPNTYTLQPQQKTEKPMLNVQWPYINVTSAIVFTTYVRLTMTGHLVLTKICKWARKKLKFLKNKTKHSLLFVFVKAHLLELLHDAAGFTSRNGERGRGAANILSYSKVKDG